MTALFLLTITQTKLKEGISEEKWEIWLKYFTNLLSKNIIHFVIEMHDILYKKK